MQRRFKMNAICMMAACLASVGVASATAFTQFHTEKAPARIAGTQVETARFTFSAGSLTCAEASFSGELPTTSSETFETAFSYGGCTYLGYTGIAVVEHSCRYRFHASGTFDIVGCEPNEPIEIGLGGACTVKIGNQTGVGTVGYANNGSGTGRTVTVTPNLRLTYSAVGPCPGGQRINETGGIYAGGKSTFSAKTSVGKVNGFFAT